MCVSPLVASSKIRRSCWMVAFLLLPRCGCSEEPSGPGTETPDAGAHDDASIAPSDAGTGDDASIASHALTVEFPAPFNLTDATSITVRGRASDSDGVQAVRINGQLADTNDDFASWQLELPLSHGANTFAISSEDRSGNVDPTAAQIVVTSEPLLFLDPSAVVIDEQSGRALLLDPFRERLVSLDLTTGDRALISGDTRGSGPALVSPVDIAIDSANGRAIIVDSPEIFGSTQGALVAIDLDTGDRTIISDNTIGAGPFFSVPRGVAVDAPNHRALVVDREGEELMAIDLDTGDRTIISNAATGSGRALGDARGIALDQARARVLVVGDTGGGAALISVDLATGDRTSITDPLTEFGGLFPRGLALDSAHDRVFTAAQDAVLSIDLNSGDRTIVSNAMNGSGPQLGQAIATGFDAATDRALVIYYHSLSDQMAVPRLLTVDVASGDRAFAGEVTIGAGASIALAEGVVLDAANDRALIIDGRNGLVAVELGSGDRTVMSDAPSTIGPALFAPTGLVLDEDGSRAFVVDRGRPAPLVIDLSTGHFSVLDGAGPELQQATGVALDGARGRALVTGFGGGRTPAMTAVDLSSGDRTILIDRDVGAGVDAFHLSGVAVDADGMRALVTESVARTLVAFDLVSGARTLIGSDIMGTGPLVLDLAESRALMLSTISLTAMSLNGGAQTVLSSRELGAGPVLTRATGIARASSSSCVLVTDDVLDSLLLIDLATGQRVIISGHAAF